MGRKLFTNALITVLYDPNRVIQALDELYPFYEVIISIFAIIIIFTMVIIITKSIERSNKHSTGPGGAHMLTFKDFPSPLLSSAPATV